MDTAVNEREEMIPAVIRPHHCISDTAQLTTISSSTQLSIIYHSLLSTERVSRLNNNTINV